MFIQIYYYLFIFFIFYFFAYLFYLVFYFLNWNTIIRNLTIS
nr:MAG TPA_asm: hypothetical protein [Caudoviricetes sp.]